jgi:predicted O-methyltransferase YrrM
MFRNNHAVKVDLAHALTIKGLIYGQKPTRVLELGLGGGESTDAILEALKFNQQQFEYTLVDNWVDYDYKMPEGVLENYGESINVVTSNEKDFVYSTKKTYDFIFSDADHYHTNEWFEYVYYNLLEKDGILIYHDINLFENCLPNLLEIYHKCKKLGLPHKLFNKNSLPNERCHRGLLVIFKN